MCLSHARDCGQTLHEAKKECGHGHFRQWVTDNCCFSIRQAQRYLKIFNNWNEITATDTGLCAKATRVSHLDIESLSISAALRILADEPDQKKTPDKTPSSFVDADCPACGHRLAKTSARYATCISCLDSKLVPLNDSSASHEPKGAFLSALSLWRRMPKPDRNAFRTFIERHRTNEEYFTERQRHIEME